MLRSAATAFPVMLLGLGACHPDAPATQQAPAALATPAAAVEPTVAPAAAAPADTLHLSGGQVLRLLPGTVAAYNQAAADSLPELNADSPDQHMETTQGQVRRQGLDLLLTPARGLVVRLTSTPPAEFKNNSTSVRYVYRGSLPGAHQWVVQAWFWESEGTVLVDQRTGSQLAVTGWPTASPDGRYVLLTSPGLGGGDEVNSISLVGITAAGPRLRWQREPTAYAPQRARWAGPNRALLQVERPDADGQLPNSPRPEYLVLTLPTTP